MNRAERVRRIALDVGRDLRVFLAELKGEGCGVRHFVVAPIPTADIFPDNDGAENERAIACINQALAQHGFFNYEPGGKTDPAVIGFDEKKKQDEPYACVRIRGRGDDSPAQFIYRAKPKPVRRQEEKGVEQVEVFTTDPEGLVDKWNDIAASALKNARMEIYEPPSPFL